VDLWDEQDGGSDEAGSDTTGGESGGETGSEWNRKENLKLKDENLIYLWTSLPYAPRGKVSKNIFFLTVTRFRSIL
jgi:hypothetical protein